MSKKLFKKLVHKYIPNIKELKDKELKLLGKFIHDPNLWHFNRHSVSTAFSTGLFAALIPVPFQMMLAAILSIIFRGNIPIAAALAWVSNPITTPPLLYLEYKIGTYVLGITPQEFRFEASVDWVMQQSYSLAAPILVGCFIAAFAFAILGNLIVRVIWRLSVISAWKKRMRRLKARKILFKRKKKRKKIKR
ncbi:MAG: DUF2062 domain-containing protein [Proteobacteria bacterium]|nr:DUF2062 domain-containing protein [Pseudomonadota bacterium]